MSENTPMRRRRPPHPVQIDDASIPHKSDEDNPVRPAREMPPHRRVRVVPIETTDDDTPRHLPESPLSSLPTPVRFGALALALILLIVGSVSITRTYLAHQEERRRLEAEAAERAQHPLYYADTITAYADAQELDPALVAAVILCESSYDPKAESRLGARGLMQLMPDTAEWVAHKLGEDGADYSFDNLYDPQTNIRFGTWYLGSWLKNPQYSSDGVTLDIIPTQDTATYASRVLRARDIYRKYYFPLELSDTQQTETES